MDIMEEQEIKIEFGLMVIDGNAPINSERLKRLDEQNATEDDSLEVLDIDVDYFDNETEFDEIKEGKAEVKDLKAAIFAMVKKKLEQLLSEMCLSSATH